MGAWTKANSTDGLLGHVELDRVLDTQNFAVSDACVGCGVRAHLSRRRIIMDGKHPTWPDAECLMCLGCVRACPARAISYGARQ